MNLVSQWQKGQSGNPSGRPKGHRNYATIYREALKRLAKEKNLTPEQIEEVILKSGLDKAMKGDYNFYRDTFDRLHGKAPQGIGTMDEDGEFVPQNISVVFVNAD